MQTVFVIFQLSWNAEVLLIPILDLFYVDQPSFFKCCKSITRVFHIVSKEPARVHHI